MKFADSANVLSLFGRLIYSFVLHRNDAPLVTEATPAADSFQENNVQTTKYYNGPVPTYFNKRVEFRQESNDTYKRDMHFSLRSERLAKFQQTLYEFLFFFFFTSAQSKGGYEKR